MRPFRTLGRWIGILLATSMTAVADDGAVRRGGPYKLIAADFTGNGQLDLAVGYHDLGMLSVEQGNGRGQFQHKSISPIGSVEGGGFVGGSFNLASRDLDRDGRPDLAVGCMGHFVLLARNMGGGRFEAKQRFPTNSDAKGVAFADLDQDGHDDLLYTARGTGRQGDTKVGQLYLRRGLGGWRFGDAVMFPAGISAYYVETGDLNEDGTLDIIVPNELGSTASYWISPSRSIFESSDRPTRQVVQTSGTRINDVRARDFTGDGHLDLLTANWSSSTISLFPGRGDGSFGKERLMEGGRHCVFFAIGDFDRDHDLDFAVTHWTEDFVSVFLNDGHGRFSPRTDYKTGLGNYGVLAVDVDGDETLDLITANYRHRSTSLLIGHGDGTFAPALTTVRSFRETAGGFVQE